jgi:hypothetical protein
VDGAHRRRGSVAVVALNLVRWHGLWLWGWTKWHQGVKREAAVSESCTSGTASRRLWPKNLDTTRSL